MPRAYDTVLKALAGAAIVLLAALPPTPAWAQGYPARPVRILVPLSPGSQSDLLARMLARYMSETWRQTVIVENHPGGAGQVAGNLVVKAAPDGYTLMLHSDGYAVSAALYGARLPYDTVRDFTRVSIVASSPSVLLVSPGLGVKSVAELVALAKARPRGLTFGSAGIGGGIHFTGEMFKLAAGIDAIHVPYKGMPEAITETMTGRIDYTFSSLQPAWPLIRDGRVLAIAVGSSQRSPVLPDVPTVAEAGVPGFGYELWWGLLAPAQTPAAIAQQISQEVARIVSLPEVRDRLLSQGVVPRGSSPEEFDAFVRAEIPKLTEVVRAAGIKVD